MISSSDLSEEQKVAMTQWAEEGADLSDIQKRLKGELGLNVTYMDARLMVLDLGIEIKAEEEEETHSPSDVQEVNRQGEEVLSGSSEELRTPPRQDQSLASSVEITTDEIARPGAMVSGSVTFSDGAKAVWVIDEYGRPGLEPETPGYQPTEADIGEFERHLRALLEG
jgi:hypothetical protein